jgi:hypothetical protein
VTSLYDLSVRLEEQTGFDSIPTIERVYERFGPGDRSIACVWPNCDHTRRDGKAMWKHVHFHHNPPAFGLTLHAFVMRHGPFEDYLSTAADRRRAREAYT